MITAAESAEPRRAFGAELLRLLAPRPGRLAFAVKLALICALTTLIAEIYQTPDAALTAYVVFFLNKPDRDESLVLNVVFTLLITLIIGLIILLAMLVMDVPLWRVAAMSAFSIGFLFVAFASKLRPLGGVITLIVGYGLDVLGTYHSGEFATRAMLYAWLFVGMPAGVSLVVNLLLGPPPRRLAERALAERLRVAAAVLREPDECTQHSFTECLRTGMGEIQGWLKLAAAEKTSPPQDIAALRQAVQSTTALLAWVDVVSHERARLLPSPLLKRLAQTLEDMAQILLKGGYPIEIALGEGHAAPAHLPPRSAELWAGMRELLAQFAEPPRSDALPARPATVAPKQTPAQAPPQPAAQPARPPAAPPSGFFLPDAFSNPEYLRYAVKTTGAAMFCYVLYSLLDWPGIHTSFITCYIVSLGTAAETIEKLTLRIVGCLSGAAAGLAAIVYVLPSLTSIQALLGVVFLGALASAWVAAGSPRIAYAGFQIAFAFFLCVIQGPSPAFDLSIARDRIIGILLGNVVAYLLFTRLWPVSVARRIDPAIATMLRRLSALAAAATAATRRSLAGEVQGALGTLEQDLQLARYEPPAMRPAEGWLRVRRRVAREIGALQGPWLLQAGREPSFDADISHRLAVLADRLSASGRPPGPALEGNTAAAEYADGQQPKTAAAARCVAADRHASPDARPLTELIRTPLESLEELVALSPPPGRDRVHTRAASHVAI